MSVKKEEVLARQLERKQERQVVDDKVETKNNMKKNKNKKSKKNKGLKAFIEGDEEFAQYNKSVAESVDMIDKSVF